MLWKNLVKTMSKNAMKKWKKIPKNYRQIFIKVVEYQKQKLQQKNNIYRRKKMETLKISSKSNPNSVAGAIAGLIKESHKAEMQAIGAGALNQAVKAVAIARGFVAPAGVDLVCIPAFAEVEVEGEDRTGIKLIVESRK